MKLTCWISRSCSKLPPKPFRNYFYVIRVAHKAWTISNDDNRVRGRGKLGMSFFGKCRFTTFYITSPFILSFPGIITKFQTKYLGPGLAITTATQTSVTWLWKEHVLPLVIWPGFIGMDAVWFSQRHIYWREDRCNRPSWKSHLYLKLRHPKDQRIAKNVLVLGSKTFRETPSSPMIDDSSLRADVTLSRIQITHVYLAINQA